MITNYCEFLAAVARELDKSGDISYYSNVDPSREWTGKPSVEFAEDEPEVRYFLSGRYQKTHRLAAYSRAADEREALHMVDDLRPLVLYQTLSRLVDAGEIYCFTVEDSGTAADIRGYSTGETFYGYVNFTVTERQQF